MTGVDSQYFVHRVKSRVVKVPVVDVGPNLDTGEFEVGRDPLELLDRQLRILERQSAEANEPVRVSSDCFCHVVVEEPAEV